MIESNATKNKHLTLDDRVDIQTGLNQGLTFKTIAKKIGKDQTTVSKEVKKHLTLSKRSVTCRKSDGTSVEEEICPRLLKTPSFATLVPKGMGTVPIKSASTTPKLPRKLMSPFSPKQGRVSP